MTVWHALWAPSATPRDVIARLNVAAVEALEEALYANPNSTLLSSALCVSGGWTSSGLTVAPPTKCDPVADPLVNLPVPPEAGDACKYSNHVVDGGKVSLTPGVYCNNLTLNAGATATLSPGTYVFRDGVFKLNSGSRLTGTGVLLFFTGTGSRLEVNSNSWLELSAPKSGALANILIYQDRKTFSDFFILNSNSHSQLEGTIYIPNSPLRLNSNGTMKASPFLSIIVRRLDLNSNSNLVIRNFAEGASPAGGTALIK
jgi:hypothetical protein